MNSKETPRPTSEYRDIRDIFNDIVSNLKLREEQKRDEREHEPGKGERRNQTRA